MSGVCDDQLVELIYDSVFDPALWTPVMEELTRRVSGEVACMTMLDVHSGEGNGVTALVPAEVMQDYFSRWAHDNPLHEVGDPLRYVEQWRPATTAMKTGSSVGCLIAAASIMSSFVRSVRITASCWASR